MIPMVGEKPPADSKTLRDFFFLLRLVVELEFHHLAQFLGFGAIDGQHERLLQRKGSSIVAEFLVERDDPFAPGLIGIAEPGPGRCAGDHLGGFDKDVGEAPGAAQEHDREWKLNEDCAQRAAENDHAPRSVGGL